MPSRQRQVGFATAVSVRRPAREDEVSVMVYFVSHAKHCEDCDVRDRVLCSKGRRYAADVQEYLFYSRGRCYSVIERDSADDDVQVEIPSGCELIPELLYALAKGLRSRREREVIISHDDRRDHPTRKSPERRARYEVVEVEPKRRREPVRRTDDRRRETVYIKGGSSSYRGDSEAQRGRRHSSYYAEPIIIVSSPRREYRR